MTKKQKAQRAYNRRYYLKNRDACINQTRAWRAAHPSYTRKRYHQNPEKHRQQRRKSNRRHRYTIRSKAREYYHNNREKCLSRRHEYVLKNLEKIRERAREYRRRHPEKHRNWVSKNQQQHRRIMQWILGRKLEPGEHVRHRNGDRTNNRPENLELYSNFETPVMFGFRGKGRWSRHFDQCVMCKSRKSKHEARGLCHSCYNAIRYRKKR